MASTAGIFDPTPPAVARAAAATALPAAGIVAAVLEDAIGRRASDIHFESEGSAARVRIRVGGALSRGYALPVATYAGCVARLKILAGLRTDEHALPQDGSFAVPDRPGFAARIATIPARLSEKVTVRLLGTFADRTLGELGMPERGYAAVRRIVEGAEGLLLICGPTGSGKTTTLYAVIREIARLPRAAVTIEDPVELRVPGATQIPIGRGLGFAEALRAVLRHDPDAIAVGEIRDPATAALAVRAALTGHLVVATVHAPDALGALVRMRSFGVDPQEFAWVLRAVIAQRSAADRFEVLEAVPALRAAIASNAPESRLRDAATEGYACQQGAQDHTSHA